MINELMTIAAVDDAMIINVPSILTRNYVEFRNDRRNRSTFELNFSNISRFYQRINKSLLKFV